MMAVVEVMVLVMVLVMVIVMVMVMSMLVEEMEVTVVTDVMGKKYFGYSRNGDGSGDCDCDGGVSDVGRSDGCR
jgi:hypothetical protein